MKVLRSKCSVLRCLLLASWTGILLVSFWGCGAFPHKVRREYPQQQNITVAQATRIAALAMQDTGFLPEVQNETSGFVGGKINDPDILGFAQTFRMQVELGRDVQGPLWVNVSCQAGPEVAVSTSLPGYVDSFFTSFEQRMQAQVKQNTWSGSPGVKAPWQQPSTQPPSSKDLQPPPPPPAADSPSIQTIQKSKEYDL